MKEGTLYKVELCSTIVLKSIRHIKLAEAAPTDRLMSSVISFCHRIFIILLFLFAVFGIIIWNCVYNINISFSGEINVF